MTTDGFVHRYLERLMESQYWPRERLVEEQRAQLEPLLRHARRHVPFYETRLDRIFNRFGDIDWDRWHEVPIVTRKEAVEHNGATLSTVLPGHQGRTQTSFTSGSTGDPLRVVHSKRAALVQSALLYRAHQWHGLDWSQDLVIWFGEDSSKGRLPEGEVGSPWGPEWLPNSTGKLIAVNRMQEAADVVKFLARRNPGYFSARPQAAHVAALEVMRLGIDVSIDAVLTFSTGVNETERTDVRTALGARMISPYSAKEGTLMAYQCPTGTHFHKNDESVLVEIVDREGWPVASGEQGRVVVTPLYNWAQPLIRYEQGDLAVAGQTCSCGRTLGVIEAISGRISHIFKLPDGRHISMSLSEDVKRAFGARMWQIAQIEPLSIEIRYVLGDAPEGDREAVVELIRTKTHPEMQVQFSRREDFHRPDGRKFIDYVYEVRDAARQVPEL